MEEIAVTPEIVSEICGYVRVGTAFNLAAVAAGYKQEQLDEIGCLLQTAIDGIWKEFADDIKKAAAQFEVMQLMKINAEGGSKGAQWLLEKMNPNKWGKPMLKINEKKITTKNLIGLPAPQLEKDKGPELDFDFDFDMNFD